MSGSLEHKIASMLMVGFDGYSISDNQYIAKAISEYGLGGVILYDLEADNYRLKNIKSPEQLRSLVYNLKSLADGDELLIGIDYEGGRVKRLDAEYGFPKTNSHKYLGDLNDLSFTYEQSSIMSNTLRDLGININFAPVVDINSNPLNPVIGKKERSFSESPRIVTAHAAEFIKAHTNKGIVTVIKHFPGHGSSMKDSHHDFVDITGTWNKNELEPYEALIRRGLVDCIMTAHVFNRNIDDEYPATLSYTFITKQLRNQMGFSGVVFSDDLNMNAIKNRYGIENAVEKAINAGVDILLISHSEVYGNNLVERMIYLIKNLLKKGSITDFRIDESYMRINNLKMKINRYEGFKNE